MPVGTSLTLFSAQPEQSSPAMPEPGRPSLAPAPSVRDERNPGARVPSLPEFETAMRPHLGAAHHLARWLTRSAADAEDALQNAVLRAFRSFDRQRPVNPRAWLLRIVRNCCYDLREQQEREPANPMLDENALETHQPAAAAVVGIVAENPEARLLRMADGHALESALQELGAEFREAFLLREVEGLSYKEIAEVAAVPIGTVMSRLSRARAQLRATLGGRRKETA
jgi:RNA polymerase sigma factor (sigma-70 family)